MRSAFTINLRSLSTLHQVSLEREARRIVEIMTRVANKLAGGGGTMAVTRDVLDAQKMLNSMGSRLQ